MPAYLLPSDAGGYDRQCPIYDLALQPIWKAGLPAHSLPDAFVATGRSPTDFRIDRIDARPSGEYQPVAPRAIWEHLRHGGVIDGLR